jgi:hypothetical protein
MTPRPNQLRPTKGWRKPPAAVIVPRPARWANPYNVAEHGQAGAVARRELAGKTLACWSPPDLPCHADVLLEAANLRHQPERP